jgi:hypothetical protein
LGVLDEAARFSSLLGVLSVWWKTSVSESVLNRAVLPQKTPKDIIGEVISLNDLLEPWVLNGFMFVSKIFIFFLPKYWL